MSAYKNRLIAALGTMVFAAAAAGAAAGKPVVAVLNFETENCKPYLSAVVAGYMSTAVAYIGTYDAVSADKIHKILEGNGLADGTAISTADAVKLGRQLGAAAVCRGKVSKAGDEYTVTVDYISTATGAVVQTKSAKVTGEANLSKAIDTIVGLTS